MDIEEEPLGSLLMTLRTGSGGRDRLMASVSEIRRRLPHLTDGELLSVISAADVAARLGDTELHMSVGQELLKEASSLRKKPED